MKSKGDHKNSVNCKCNLTHRQGNYKLVIDTWSVCLKISSNRLLKTLH